MTYPEEYLDRVRAANRRRVEDAMKSGRNPPIPVRQCLVCGTLTSEIQYFGGVVHEAHFHKRAVKLDMTLRPCSLPDSNNG